MLALLFGAILTHRVVSAGAPVKVIVDTDIGRDMDDSWALAFMLGRQDVFDIQLILTATFDTLGKAKIVAKNLDAVSRTDVAVGIGVPTPYNPPGQPPVQHCRVGPMYPWASSYNLSAYPGKLYEDGVAQMASVIAKIPDVLILELAPLTNILSLHRRFPLLDTTRVRFYAMGGAIRKGYKNRPFLEPEYNIFSDLAAAEAVFNSSHDHSEDNIQWAEFVDAPLDTSGTIQVYGDEYNLLLSAEKNGNQIVHTLLNAYRIWCKCPTNFAITLSDCDLTYTGCFQNHSIALQAFSPLNSSTNLFDVQPTIMAAAALVPGSGLPALGDMLVLEYLTIAVDAFSLTVPSYSAFGIGFKGGTRVSVATSWVPPAGVKDGGLSIFKWALVSSLILHDSAGTLDQHNHPVYNNTFLV